MSNLLKAAIADAKAVRATALANAKAALEEAFQPKMQEMLARKLRQEMEDEDEVEVEPASVDMDAPVELEVQPEDDVAPAIMDGEEVSHDDTDEDAEEIEEKYLPRGYGHPDPVHQSAEADELTEEESYALDHAPDGYETEDAHDGDPAPKTYHKDNGGTSEIPAEKSAEIKYIDREVASITADPQGGNVTKTYSKNNGGTSALKEEDDMDIDDQTLEEILKELEDEVNGEHDEEVKEVKLAHSSELSDPAVRGEAVHGDEEKEKNMDETEDEELDLSDLMEDEHEKESMEDESMEETEKENLSLKAELEEYRNAVTYLRDRINEVNLLNAKLLYTNKLFKSNALSNQQKLRVIESFDRTKSVREAKLVYATLSESLNIGVKAKPVLVAKKRPALKSITEGFASKVVASTKPTKPVVLTEGAEMANRFKKLAGIKN